MSFAHIQTNRLQVWSRLAACLLTLMLGSAQVVVAQTTASGAVGSAEDCRQMEGFDAPVAKPFTATRMETQVRTLADGSTVTTRYRSFEARDSEGRTYSAGEFLSGPGAQQTGKKVLGMRIIDPAAKTITSWTTGQNDFTVRVMHVVNAARDTPLPSPDPRIPRLDGKMVNGVFAVGFRVTGVIAEGEQGNSRPLTNTTEWWCSPELKVNVLEVSHSMIAGDRTIELTDIQPGEPDPAVFRLPEGFAIKHVRSDAF